ncbi:hypothetical protein [Mesorhizobium sp. M1A.F.Ca.ET.072.01.1.1]|uniref:hypothetical protein n=1 Tax=Mesorhizobium sp. M1A.F.Ca.ET.072.01.1.1 TaxID=2496753 RepID=UPI000FEC1A7F|nr:hypothetical protein [Mesorhizobium sp. M1A.F.Ca.ET.072.01.1.1]
MTRLPLHLGAVLEKLQEQLALGGDVELLPPPGRHRLHRTQDNTSRLQSRRRRRRTKANAPPLGRTRRTLGILLGDLFSHEPIIEIDFRKGSSGNEQQAAPFRPFRCAICL